MGTDGYEVKEGLLYYKSYWIKNEGNIAVVGMTDFAAKQAKDIAFLELPEEGAVAKAGESVGNIESAKWAGEVIAPVSGKVVAVNKDLESSPEQVNKRPYDSWFLKIDMSDKAELDSLMDSKQYKKYVEEEA